MRGMAELVIQDYILDLEEPRCNWRKSRFDQLSYSRWAAKEILRYVKKHRDLKAIDAIEDFISMIDRFSNINTDTNYVFSIARDVAEDILEIFLAME